MAVVAARDGAPDPRALRAEFHEAMGHLKVGWKSIRRMVKSAWAGFSGMGSVIQVDWLPSTGWLTFYSHWRH